MLIMTEEEYLAANGAGFMDGAEPALHRTPGGFPARGNNSRRAHLDRVQDAMKHNNTRREQLRAEYAAKVQSGEIVPPSRAQRLERIAAGHPDNPSTQAARRLLEKLNKTKEG